MLPVVVRHDPNYRGRSIELLHIVAVDTHFDMVDGIALGDSAPGPAQGDDISVNILATSCYLSVYYCSSSPMHGLSAETIPATNAE